MKQKHLRMILPAVVALLMAAQMPAYAQPAPAAAPVMPVTRSGLPERIVRPMRAVDQMTLRAEGVMVRLWGIKPAETNRMPLELRALDLMDGLIQEQPVNCRIMGGVMPELLGRCVTKGNHDLALSLLAQGFVVVDRRQTYDSVFASAYEKAQEQARLNRRGVWASLDDDGNKNPFDSLPPLLKILLPLGLIVGPFGGLLVVALVVRHWFARMAATQAHENQRAQQKETQLRQRERQVLVSTIEGELLENKNKIEAFLVIYGDMLRQFREGGDDLKYQQVGDIVQKHPHYSRAVFENNVGKMSLLDVHVAGRLSKLYAALPTGNEYINIDPNVPLDTAIKLVEKVIHETEQVLPEMNAVLDSLRTGTDDGV